MSRYPDSNRGPTHYECVALPTEPYRQPLVSCTPAGARTLDTLIKSQVLYQLSYKRIFFGFAGAKVRTFIGTAKYFDYFFEIIFKKEEHLPKRKCPYYYYRCSRETILQALV